MQRMGFLSTGLIVFFVACISSVFGGVWVCAYLYKLGKRKSQIQPVDQPVAKMVEPFNTKKLWERGKRKPAVTLTEENESTKTISVNGVIAKGPVSDAGDEEAMIGDEGEGGINPCSARTPSPVPVIPAPDPQTNAVTSTTTAVEVS